MPRGKKGFGQREVLIRLRSGQALGFARDGGTGNRNALGEKCFILLDAIYLSKQDLAGEIFCWIEDDIPAPLME
jgi:hypothetical protein